MSIEEFETRFFDPKMMTTYIENKNIWVEQFKATPKEDKWTTYFMLLGTLAAHGRITFDEYQRLGTSQYQQKIDPTPERLYALTALIDLLK